MLLMPFTTCVKQPFDAFSVKANNSPP